MKVALNAHLGGRGTQDDNAKVEAIFLNSGSGQIGTPLTIGPVTAADRGNVTALLARSGQVFRPERDPLRASRDHGDARRRARLQRRLRGQRAAPHRRSNTLVRRDDHQRPGTQPGRLGNHQVGGRRARALRRVGADRGRRRGPLRLVRGPGRRRDQPRRARTTSRRRRASPAKARSSSSTTRPRSSGTYNVRRTNICCNFGTTAKLRQQRDHRRPPPEQRLPHRRRHAHRHGPSRVLVDERLSERHRPGTLLRSHGLSRARCRCPGAGFKAIGSGTGAVGREVIVDSGATATWTGGDFYGEGVGGVFRNRGTFDIRTDDDSPVSGGSMQVINEPGAVFKKTAGSMAKRDELQQPVRQRRPRAGDDRASPIDASGHRFHGGDFEIGSGGALLLTIWNARISRPLRTSPEHGSFELSSGVVNFGGPYDVG